MNWIIEHWVILLAIAMLGLAIRGVYKRDERDHFLDDFDY